LVSTAYDSWRTFLIPATKPCFVFTASIFLLESLILLSRIPALHGLGLLDYTSPSHAMLLINVLLVNGLTMIAVSLAFSSVIRSKRA
jgi:hypothetical protein